MSNDEKEMQTVFIEKTGPITSPKDLEELAKETIVEKGENDEQ